MRSILLATVTLALWAGPAHAQLTVIDPAAIAKQVEQIRQTMQMIEQGKEQIAEAQRLYNDLNKLTDIPSVAIQLGKDGLRTIGVTDSLTDLSSGRASSGNSAIGQKAQAYYQRFLRPSDSGAAATPAERAYRDAMEATGNRIATSAAVADITGEAVQSRAAGLGELQARLGTATTAKEVQDLQARIALEQAQASNDDTRLRALEMTQRVAAATRAQARTDAGRAARQRDADFLGGRR